MAVLATKTMIGTRRAHFHNDGDLTVEKLQDVTDIVEVNKALYNAHDERTPFKGDLVRVAQIPLVLLWELRGKGLFGNDHEKTRDWLNDPDNLLFRTRPGRV